MQEWRPIKEIPSELKDGRQVLLWEGQVIACRWSVANIVQGWDSGFASEVDGEPIMVEFATHYNEVTPP